VRKETKGIEKREHEKTEKKQRMTEDNRIKG
jgi:hypothetical protein